MEFVPISLERNPDEIHTYLQQGKTVLSRKFNLPSFIHWSALKHAAALVEPWGGSVVEIGCGEGYLIPTLSKYFDKVVGIDASERMFNTVRRNFQFPNVTYLLDDIASLQRSELLVERYDWVICLEVLEHVRQWDIALHNMISLLCLGKRILLSMPVEVGLPLLAKEIGRIVFYGKGSGWKWGRFVRKLFGSRSSIPREGYGSHMGFDYRAALDYPQGISSIDIKSISFYPIDLEYIGLRVYVVAQKVR